MRLSKWKKSKSLSTILTEHGYYDIEFIKSIVKQGRIPMTIVEKTAQDLIKQGKIVKELVP